MIIVSLKHRLDGNWSFDIRAKGNNVPLAVSPNSYSSLDDCLDAAKGLAQEQSGPSKYEIVEEQKE